MAIAIDDLPLEDDLGSDELYFDDPFEQASPNSLEEIDRDIIVFDGEAFPHYGLLACSKGTYIKNEDEPLSTNECFQFLCEQGEEGTLHFGFAFGYDFNNAMRDLSKQHLQRLRLNGSVRWKEWSITHIPGKRISIRNIHSGDYCTLWDLFPFVQCSFVKWIEEWELADKETVARIKNMKEQRSDFEVDDFDSILKYCLEECTLAVIGAKKLIGTCEKVGIHLTSFYGAGSLASAMLKKHNIFWYIGDTPKHIEDLANAAYYGGRSETSIIGRAGKCFFYDINSAYPAAAAKCPCLAHGTWREASSDELCGMSQRGIEENGAHILPDFSLCEVEWDLRQRKNLWFGPFPTHPNRGSIRYPLAGSGTYWGCEVNAAMRMYPCEIRIRSAHIFEPNCAHQPFSFVRYTYEERRALKAKKDFGHMPLKLGLNSLYGKCAQRVGNAPYRCLVWAGLMTAMTRAMILDAVAQNPEAILSIATDGIVSKEELDLPVSGKLGEWDRKEVEWFFSAQCGVYFYQLTGENQTTKKSRGFLAKELSLELIEAELKRNGVLGKVDVVARRFIGYRSALQRKNWNEWNTWADVTKRLRLRSEPRRRTIGGLERLPQIARSIGAVVVTKDFIRTIPPLDCAPFKPDEREIHWELDWNADLDMMLEQPTLFDAEPL